MLALIGVIGVLWAWSRHLGDFAIVALGTGIHYTTVLKTIKACLAFNTVISSLSAFVNSGIACGADGWVKSTLEAIMTCWTKLINILW